MKQITLQQLQSLIAYLKGKPWEEAHPIITMLTSLPDVVAKKDTPVTPKKVMGPEAKLYQTIRKATPNIIYNRIENLGVQGMPDTLCYNKKKQFFTVEFKIAKGNSVRLSAHQISWHFNHPDNTFICIQTLGPRANKLFHLVPGSMIEELAACSLALEDYRLSLSAIAEKFDDVGLTLENFGA